VNWADNFLKVSLVDRLALCGRRGAVEDRTQFGIGDGEFPLRRCAKSKEIVRGRRQKSNQPRPPTAHRTFKVPLCTLSLCPCTHMEGCARTKT
jgi:hypothetical protein